MRRFSTTAGRQAISRTRYAPRPTTKPAAGSAASAAARPARAAAKPAAATSSASNITSRVATGSPAVGPSVGSSLPAGGAAGSATASPAAPSFSPRLVPELKTQPTSTRVQDVIDPDAFVVQDDPATAIDDGSVDPSTDWTTSYQGLGSAAFEPRVIDILLAPIVPEDVEITPDGLLYLPEIKYRRILNRAFGPGAWGIAPRTKTMVTQRQVTREYALVCLGRLVSVSRGEMDYFSAEGITTAMEGCKSNALMRCCKDLGIASELWDPTFIRAFKGKYCDTKFFEKKRRFVWKRKDRAWEYPYV